MLGMGWMCWSCMPGTKHNIPRRGFTDGKPKENLPQLGRTRPVLDRKRVRKGLGVLDLNLLNLGLRHQGWPCLYIRSFKQPDPFPNSWGWAAMAAHSWPPPARPGASKSPSFFEGLEARKALKTCEAWSGCSRVAHRRHQTGNDPGEIW